MKATHLISHLCKIIDECGDVEVMVRRLESRLLDPVKNIDEVILDGNDPYNWKVVAVLNRLSEDKEK